MTSAALPAVLTGHPFIRREQAFGLRVEKVAPRASETHPGRRRAGLASVLPRGIPGGRKSAALASAGTMAVIGVTTMAGLMFGEGAGIEPAKAATGIHTAQISGVPAIVGNRIPDDYRGIVPGEQLVYYHPAPLVGENTIEERDASGCAWLRVPAKTEGIRAYPKIGAGEIQECSDPAKAVRPLVARMKKDTLPDMAGVSLRIVDIRDAATGRSMLAAALPQDMAPAAPIAEQAPATAQYTAAPPSMPSGIAAIPNQAQPARRVAVSTAADSLTAPRNPIAERRPSQQAQSSTRGRSAPLEPIRYAEPYVPPADDKLVPISGSASRPAPTAELRAIRPGAGGETLPGQRASDSPAGDPLTSISG